MIQAALRHVVPCLVLALAATQPAVAAEPVPPPWRIVLLRSSDSQLPSSIEMDTAFREALTASGGTKFEIFPEDLDTLRFPQEALDAELLALLRRKHGERPPHVVLASGPTALEFAERHHEKLWPGAALIYSAVPDETLRTIRLDHAVGGVTMRFEFAKTLELALALRPQTRRVVFVGGAAAFDRSLADQARSAMPEFSGKLEADFLLGLPLDEALARVSRLPADAIVIPLTMFRDGNGQAVVPIDAAKQIGENASVPSFAIVETWMGKSQVGGIGNRFGDSGRAAADMALTILEGRGPGTHLTGFLRPICFVDWRQLRRWGIDESRVPAGCEIRYREQSFWALYWQWLLAGAAFMVLQSALIIALFTQLQRRQRAEESVQKQRFELARASRLAIAAELTGSIAHEINQPLGAILSNSDAADLMLESGVDRREKLREILADIRRDSLRASEVIRRLRSLLGNHPVERKPFELNDALREVESLLMAEARRRAIALDVRPARTDVTIVGDRIQIQQVLTNLILNAMDAVADVTADHRTVRVTIATAGQGVDITVRDNGHGIAPENLPRLFDSFFTTKPGGMGLGLSISRTLVEAHGGRLRVESSMGEGAVFHVELPTDDGAGVVPQG